MPEQENPPDMEDVTMSDEYGDPDVPMNTSTGTQQPPAPPQDPPQQEAKGPVTRERSRSRDRDQPTQPQQPDQTDKGELAGGAIV